MRVRLRTAAVLFCAALCLAYGQEAPAPPGPGGWQPGDRGMGGFGMGRGTVGTVTEASADHFTVKTELGESYTIHFSVNTRILKQPPGGGGFRRGQGRGQGESQGAEEEPLRTPPQAIKATQIKVGDVIAAGGEVDAAAKSIGAVFILLVDPERAKEMRAMEASYGKTWLAGRVTAINEVKVSLEGAPDRTVHSFVADENTTFRKRREPITLADVQVGDMVRVEGVLKDGTFIAGSVVVMTPGPRGGGNSPGISTPSAGPQ